jgi:glycosyltransferase involved in cell wall biosynthesis
MNGVQVYRVPKLELFKKTSAANLNWVGLRFLKLRSSLGYLVEYCYFTAACLVVSAYLFIRRGFDVIHAHNPPDTLFVVALPFKLFGKKFVFDHHDLCPELYRSRYRTEEGFFTRLLRVFEWCSLKLADITIATNESYRQVQMRRAKKDPQTIFVVRNGPDKLRMSPVPPSPRLKAMNKCILCYVGSLNPQDGVDYLLRSLRCLVHDLKRSDFHCVIMGSGDSLQDLRELAGKLQLDGCVELTGFVSDEDLQANLAAADICVDPDPSSPLNDVSTWIKIMEYMAYAKPIVSFDLVETRFSAGEAAMYVKPNGEAEFAQTIVQLMEQPELRKRMGAYGRQRVEQELQWTKVGPNLLVAYETLLARK